MLIVLPVLAAALFLVSFNPLVGYTNLNVNSSIQTTLNCSYATRQVSVSLIWEMCLAAVVSMFALAYLVTVQERDNRELFFWTKFLHVQKRSLLKQVDPFSPEQLQEWFETSISRKNSRIAGDFHDDEEVGPEVSTSVAGTSLAKFMPSGASSKSTNMSPTSSASFRVASPSVSIGTSGHGSRLARTISHASADSPSVRHGSREYWDIPEDDLILGEVVAAGGAGVVWRATLDGKVVAAKKIRAMSDLMMQADGIRELAGEVRILGRLSHVNVLKFLGLCIKHPDDEDQPVSVFIVTEWCNQNLRTWIANLAELAQIPGALQGTGLVEVSDRDRYDVAAQVANGMKYLHSRHIIHRDLKPENILIADDGRACICDFGLSVATKKGRQRSQSNELRGTPGYIAPEIYLAAGRQKLEKHESASASTMTSTSIDRDFEITAMIDVFAYGIILWEVFAKNGSVFEVSDTRELDTRLATANAKTIMSTLPIPDVKHLDPCCSKEVQDCMKACWSQDADQRPSFSKISRTLRLVMQYYDCAEEYQDIHHSYAASYKSESGMFSTNPNSRSARSVLLTERSRPKPSVIVAVTEAGVTSDSATIVGTAPRKQSLVSGRAPSSSFQMMGAVAKAPVYERGYAQALYFTMRCWGPHNLHFASLKQEYAFLNAAVTTKAFFRFLKVALASVVTIQIVRAIYLTASIGAVRELNDGQNYDPIDFIDLYMINFSNVFWIVVALFCAYITKCQQYWACNVRVAVILSQLVMFVLLPSVTFPPLVTGSFVNYSSSPYANSSVYPPMDATFHRGYVQPTPEFQCGGAEWSPFANDRETSFCQSLNFQFSLGTMSFFRYVRVDRWSMGVCICVCIYVVATQHSFAFDVVR